MTFNPRENQIADMKRSVSCSEQLKRDRAAARRKTYYAAAHDRLLSTARKESKNETSTAT